MPVKSPGYAREAGRMYFLDGTGKLSKTVIMHKPAITNRQIEMAVLYSL